MFRRTQDIAASISAAFKSTRGATAIEYGLIAGGISIAIIAVVVTLGTNLTALFTNVAAGLTN